MIISDPKNKIILSILWGLGFSMIFRKVCTSNCDIVIPVDPNDIKNKKFKQDSGQNGDSSCVTYSREIVDCNESK